jgi:SPP1 family predicted phage head-tail adaptor
VARNSIRAGKLRHYCSIEHFLVSGKGDRGQPTGGWGSILTGVPMDVQPLRGQQVEIAHQLVARASHWIYMRYPSGITPGITAGMRVNYTANGVTRYFAIGHVDEGDFRHHNMRLLVTEQTTGAT